MNTPHDLIGLAAAEVIGEVIAGGTGHAAYRPETSPEADALGIGPGRAAGPGPPGWRLELALELHGPAAAVRRTDRLDPLGELVDLLPRAGIEAAADLRPQRAADLPELAPELRRALRDAVATRLLSGLIESRAGGAFRPELMAAIIDYLIELSSSRVEANALTHGIVITDHFAEPPRFEFDYPGDLRSAKRAPLLFDGQRSVLIVDLAGRARTEVQLHRLERFSPEARPLRHRGHRALDGGLLVAETTRAIGGIGLYLRTDRSIWVFGDGNPLLVRQAERWSAFPLQLATAIAEMIGNEAAATLLARTAFLISARTDGAILAVVDDPDALVGVVPDKDRYDERDQVDLASMSTETRLHHLIDAAELDAQTLARLASLDGATVVDRQGRLIAYGAVVSSTDSIHEGARTAAARSLSTVAEVVLKVSTDGDITIFRHGAAVATLLRSSSAR